MHHFSIAIKSADVSRKTAPIPALRSSEIRERMELRESFWVGSSAERKKASMLADLLGLPYHTSADGRGGFNVYYLPPIPASVNNTKRSGE